MKPKPVATFSGSLGKDWQIYICSRRKAPKAVFRDENDTSHAKGARLCGKTYFSGRRAGQIWVCSDQPFPDVVDTLLHEVLHTVWAHHGLNGVINEALVNEAATGLAYSLCSAKWDWTAVGALRDKLITRA